MAEDINKKITIDVEVSSDGQQQISQYKMAFDSLRSSISGLSNPLTGLSKNISSLDKDLSKLTDSITKLNKQNQSVTSEGNKTKEIVAGLSDTFKIFYDAIGYVKDAIGSLEGALSGGLALILTFAPEIADFVGAMFKGKEAIDETKLSTDTLNNALESTDYSNAIKQVNELKINVGLAKERFLDKKEVLQQYNETLGKTMGKATDLNQVEANLVKNGDAYIKMTLLKASAQLALQDAAKKAYEAEQDNKKSDDDSLTFWDKTLGVIKGGVAHAIGSMDMLAQTEIDMVNTAKQRRKEAVDDANKQKDALLSIAKKFESDAATIAKNSGLNFYSGEFTPDGSGNNKKAQQQRMAAALTESEKLLKDSLARRLQATYEAYGTETLAENNHYNHQLTSLKKLYADKLIRQDEYEKVSKQLETEHHANIAAIIDKFNKQDADKVTQAKNELAELNIKAMHDGSAKEIEEIKQQHTLNMQQLDKNDAELKEQQKKLATELGDILVANPYADVTELKTRLDSVNQLIAISGQKRAAIEQQTADAIKKINDQEAQDKLIKNDLKAKDAANNPDGKLAAEKKLVTDKYNFEIEQAKGSAEKIKDLEDSKNKEIKALDDAARKKKQEDADKTEQEIKDFAIKETQKISAEVFSIISQSIKQASDTKIASLEKDKTTELSNTSLTSAQKLAIEQKYKKQEAAVKAKAFKDEQKASIAQAVINGALAITKGTAQSGIFSALYIPTIIAETALQVAKIAAQKPPAYAKGGLHYSSDGRGGVLPGYSRTDNTNAYLRSGEGIVVSEAMQAPWARNLVSAINVGFGGRDFSMINPGRGYAVGGIFTDGGDANRYYNAPVTDQKNLANTIAYQMINNFPPVYVDVKDINNQQNILAQTINRVNL